MTLLLKKSQDRQLWDQSSFCLPKDVFMAVEGEDAYLLDFYRGRFYGLDAMATLMLTRVLQGSAKAAVSQVASEYGASLERVRADLAGLLQTLIAQKLLLDEGVDNSKRWALNLLPFIEKLGTVFLRGGTARKVLKNGAGAKTSCPFDQPVIPPSRRLVKLLLALSQFSFRLLGWARTVEFWRSCHFLACSERHPRTQEVIQSVDRIVREAAAATVCLPVACKERALVAYQLLRMKYGLPADLVVGIERHPFRAHAWVECEGEIVADDPSRCETFTPVARYH